MGYYRRSSSSSDWKPMKLSSLLSSLVISLMAFGAAAASAQPLSLEIARAVRGTPAVGIHYNTWFYGESQKGADGYCTSHPWSTNPLWLPGTKSLLFAENPNGYCYDNFQSGSAAVHAPWLSHLNVDYVIYDVTNESKSNDPVHDKSYQGAIASMPVFAAYAPHPIRSVFMFSATSWAQFECSVTNNCASSVGPQDEVFTLNEYMTSHFADLYQRYQTDSSAFMTLEGKPLLLVYVNRGRNVKDRTTGRPYFTGPGGYIPSVDQFNPEIQKYPNGTIRLQDAFTVRYAIAGEGTDFRGISNKIWMWDCQQCQFSEASFAGLFNSALKFRDLGQLKDGFVQGLSKLTVVMSPWNSFSGSGDEKGPYSVTLEPNTTLYKVDSTPGNYNPYFFYDNVAAIIHDVTGRTDAPAPQKLYRPADVSMLDTNWAPIDPNRYYALKNAITQKCVDVTGGSQSNGTPLQQWDCIPGNPNQKWQIRLQPSGAFSLISQASGKCLDFAAPNWFSNGNTVQQWECSGAPNQSFSFNLLPDFPVLYHIKSMTPNQCLDVPSGNAANGQLLQSWECSNLKENPVHNQSFYLSPQ